MPIHNLKCISCAFEGEFLIFNPITQFEGCKLENGDYDLSSLDPECPIVCPKCRKSVFKKLLAIPGIMKVNLAKWQEGLGSCKK